MHYMEQGVSGVYLPLTGGTLTGATNGVTAAAGTVDTTLITAAFVGAAWTAFTPTLSANSGTLTSATAAGRYKQIGKLYFYMLRITVTTNGTAAGYLIFTLPNSSTPVSPGCGSGVDERNNHACTVRHGTGSNTALIFSYDGTYPAADGSSFDISGFYEAS